MKDKEVFVAVSMPNGEIMRVIAPIDAVTLKSKIEKENPNLSGIEALTKAMKLIKAQKAEE